MKLLAKSLFLFTAPLSIFPLSAAVVTLSYTEFFDYAIAGIVGHPSATWSATIDSLLAPGNPFPAQPASVNPDFTLSGLGTNGSPSLIWQAGSISGAVPASFTLGGSSYLVLPSFPLFPSCTLPCSEVANHPDQALGASVIPFQSSTPDMYAGVATTVPEPSSEFAVVLASLVFALMLKRSKQPPRPAFLDEGGGAMAARSDLA